MSDTDPSQPTVSAVPDPTPPSRVSPLLALLVPQLYAVYIVFNLFVINRFEVPIAQTLRPLGILIVVTLVLTLVQMVIARGRDMRRAAAATSLLLLVFFTQDIANDFLINPVCKLLLIPWDILYAIWNLLSVVIAVWLLRTRRDVSAAFLLSALVGGILLVPNLPTVAQTVWTGLRTGQWGTPQDARALADAQEAARARSDREAVTLPAGELPPPAPPKPQDSPPSKTPPSRAPVQTNMPDLYVLILDAYGRQDVLQTLYGVDNEPFLRGLTDQGFSVARQSRANYIQTVLALESALNFEYLTEDGTINFLDRGVDRIQASTVAKNLRNQGYQIVYVATGFPLGGAGYADIQRDPAPLVQEIFTPLERSILDKSPFAPLMVNEHVAFDRHRLKLLAALSEFSEAAKIPGPKFVLAHILAPHPPFIFGAHGESVYPKEGIFKIGDATDFIRKSTPEEYKKGYANQVQYLNTKILETVANLRKNATRPAVIVVMGDHGPRRETNWRSLEKTNVHEVFYNLMAVSAPPAYARTVAAATTGDTTAVAVFRRLFTDIYATPYPPIPNRSYYSTLALPYHFTDVTAQVAGQAAKEEGTR